MRAVNFVCFISADYKVHCYNYRYLSGEKINFTGHKSAPEERTRTRIRLKQNCRRFYCSNVFSQTTVLCLCDARKLTGEVSKINFHLFYSRLSITVQPVLRFRSCFLQRSCFIYVRCLVVPFTSRSSSSV